MGNAWVDLRSDTVTRPSAGMRRAMAEDEVGYDVFGCDYFSNVVWGARTSMSIGLITITGILLIGVNTPPKRAEL